jgi:opacity protein-like surface antigen
MSKIKFGILSGMLCAMSAISLSTLAYGEAKPMQTFSPEAFAPGFYMGVYVGYADTNLEGWFDGTVADQNGPYIQTSTHSSTGPAAAIDFGYDISKLFAVEAGYTSVINKTEIFNFTSRTTPNLIRISDVTTRAVDLVGKLKGRIGDNFELYAKAGLGYLMTNGLQDGDANSKTQTTTMVFLNNIENNLCLAYGLGAAVNVTKNLSLDLSWMHYSGRPALKISSNLIVDPNQNGSPMVISDTQPGLDFYGLGLTYKFVE